MAAPAGAGDRLVLAWRPRALPLAPVAVAAEGDAARALGRRLAALDDGALTALAAVAGRDVLLVVGDALPWSDGAIYLGRDPEAPSLLLPTALAPSLPAAVLARAIEARASGGPVAVLPSRRLIPCGAARAIARARLVAWLEAPPSPAGHGAPPSPAGHGAR